MQFLALIALFAGSSLAAKYAAGAPCHSNKECDKNCFQGQWTITHEDDDYFLACDVATPDPVQYYRAQCQVQDSAGIPIIGGGRTGLRYDAQSTGTACTAVGGLECERGCVVTGKRSTEGDSRSAWEAACKSAGSVIAPFVEYDSEKTVKVISSC